MNEILETAMQFGPVIGAVLVPLIGGVLVPLMGVRFGPRDPAAIRAMSRHAKLHDALPEEARGPIRKLMEYEATKYARATMRKGERKIHWSNATALVFVAFIIGFAEYLLIVVAFVWWPATILAGLLGGFGIALLAHGAQQVLQYEDGDPLEETASGADQANAERSARERTDVGI